MLPKLKGIALSVIFSIVSVFLWSICATGQAPELSFVLVIGGSLGLVSGLANAIVLGGRYPVEVALVAALALWAMVGYILIDAFGSSGLDQYQLAVSTVLALVFGTMSGLGFKLGNR